MLQQANPNVRPIVANTYIVDPLSMHILHRVPVADTIAHHNYMLHMPGMPGYLSTNCPCCPVVTKHCGQAIPEDVQEFYKHSLRILCTDGAECLIVKHRGFVERQPIPSVAL